MFQVGKTYKHRDKDTIFAPWYVGIEVTFGMHSVLGEISIPNVNMHLYEDVLPKESITIGYVNIYKSLDTGKLRAGRLIGNKGDAELNISESTLEKHIHTLKVEYQEK